MLGKATITLGIGPHSVVFFCYKRDALFVVGCTRTCYRYPRYKTALVDKLHRHCSSIRLNPWTLDLHASKIHCTITQ